MSLQKYRFSKSRSRSRRAHYYKIDAPNVINCPNCGAGKLPHRVCPECGFYNKRKVISKKVKVKKEDKKK